MAVRIKLIFDGVDITKCMFLVDSKHVIIKDLEKGIKKRFPIEKSSKVSLFIDDFILPSKDGIELIHDNDIVFVRVRLKPDISVCLDECETKKEKIKKRKRKSSGTAENSQLLTASTPCENDRNKKQLLVNESVNKKKKVEEVNDTESAKKNKKIDKKKKHKLKKSISDKSLDRIQCNSQTNTNDETEVISKKQAKSSQLEKVLDKDNVSKESKKKKQTATMDVQSSSSSSDSSSSDTSSSDGNKRPRIKWNTELSKTKNNITTNKQGTKNAVEVPTASVDNKTKVKVRQVKENGDKKHIFFESDPDSSSDDDDTDLGNIQEETGNEVGIKSTEMNDENKEDGWKEEEIQEMNSEGLRNQEIQKEVVEKQPTNLPPPPSRDYSKLNPLIGPPRVGDVICYKILELSASYMPEVSAYKEGKVIEYDATSQSVTLELCEGFTSSENMKREGRFEMELDEEYIQDKTEHENVVSVQWSAVMAPRLIT